MEKTEECLGTVKARDLSSHKGYGSRNMSKKREMIVECGEDQTWVR